MMFLLQEEAVHTGEGLKKESFMEEVTLIPYTTPLASCVTLGQLSNPLCILVSFVKLG